MESGLRNEWRGVGLRLASAAALLGAALGPSSCGRGSPDSERPSAILITLDTTRADALGSYGRKPSLTPHLDALAAESVVYDFAHTVAPITLPSHASMLTGLYPVRHTVRDNGVAPVPQSARTVAEAAREAGYDTAAFVAAIVLDGSFALDQGFDVYDAPVDVDPTAMDIHGDRSAREMVDRALAWLDARDGGRPFFLWVHVFDPHSPYEPPAEFRRGGSVEALYAGEVQGMDRELGRLVQGLKAAGVFERSTVVVVADHGEALGQNGELTHGAFCYEPVLRVPLFVRQPGGPRAGERSNDVVSVVDVAPTLVDALELAPLGAIDGLSLLGAPLPAERGVYFECYSGYLSYGWSPLSGWIDARGKYLHSSSPEFFELGSDPTEATNRFGQLDVGRYEQGIAQVAERPALEAGGDATTEALVEQIRSLGYAALGPQRADLPHPLAPSPLPSPAERKDELKAAYRGYDLLRAGQVGAAIELFQSLVAENPRQWFVLDHLATALIRAERFPEAIAPLQTLLRNGVERPANYYNLGACLYISGQRAEAVRAFRRAVELAPGNAPFATKLAEILRMEGRPDEAQAVLDELRQRTARGE